jgi:hypothetical protein
MVPVKGGADTDADADADAAAAGVAAGNHAGVVAMLTRSQAPLTPAQARALKRVSTSI